MKIEKAVSPPPRSRPGRPSKYPFGEMEVWDCLLITDPETFQRAAKAAIQYGARNNKKFRTRNTEDGLRIWRIE